MLTERTLGKVKAALAVSTLALTTTVAVASTLSIRPAWPLPQYAQTNIIPGNLARDVGFNFAVVDLNEDGRPDIATITFEPVDNFFDNGAVSVFLQDATGAFVKNGDYPINQRTHLSVANRNFIAADFNEDGRVDVITDDFGGSDLMLLLGRGTGTFQAPVPLGLSVSERFVAVGDVNSDHHLDLLSADPGGGVSLLLGRGNGTFYQGPILATAGEPGTILVGDVNLDGAVDVVSATLVDSNQTRNAEVFLGNGDGTFKPGIVTGMGSQAGGHAALADLNGDGRLDYVPLDFQLSVVQIWLGQGDGHFIRGESYPAGDQPARVFVGDVNGDGIPDLMVDSFSYFERPLTVLLGNGDGTFQSRQLFSVGSARRASRPTLIDLNRDGLQDLVLLAVSGADPNYFTVALNQGIQPDPNLGFLLEVQDGTSASLVLDASTNLRDWQALVTNSPSLSRWRFFDTNAASPQRFYRTRSP